MIVIIFIRLLVNAVLSLFGVGLTLGLAPRLLDKTIIYFQLIAWHLKKCPEQLL